MGRAVDDGHATFSSLSAHSCSPTAAGSLVCCPFVGVSHQLLALDDEEFYEKQRPLTLEEVRQLAGFLKDWLCR